MRLALAGAVIIALMAAVLGCKGSPPAPIRPLPAIQQDKEGPEAPEFPGALQWFNIDRPLSIKELRGKVILLDFWTYCCINCMHVIPDLRKLEAKYPNELQVIGVHSAKFKNEKDSSNIREAIIRYEIEHPVVNDNQMEIWTTFGINSWPTLMVIKPDGKVLGVASGEGHYDVLDKVIGDLIKEYDAKGLVNRKPIKLALEKENRPKSVLSYPGKIAGDPIQGRLFFTDSNHNRVVIASLSGAIEEVIGEGSPGLTDGDFTAAQFFRPQGVAYDPIRKALYVADTENHAIRKIDLAAKRVTTLAGTGKQAREYPPIGGVGRLAALSSPWDLIQLGNTLYIAMAGTHQLWSLDLTTMKVEPYAGTAQENILDGPLTQSRLAQPSGITTDGKRLYFADSEVSAARTADLIPTGAVHTLIGQGLFEFGDIDGKFPTARLQHPLGVAFYDGYLYVADTYNHKIKRIFAATRTVETVVGAGTRGLADGPAKTAMLNEPSGLTFVKGKAYIADANNHVIRVYDPATKLVSTLKLTGIEKLAHRAMPAFRGKEVALPAQDISATAKWLELNIALPKGTKFNKTAPFTIKSTSTKPDAISVQDSGISEPAARLKLPIQPKTGEATLSVELNVNYCSEANDGLCYFKEVRLLLPVRITPTGTESPTISLTL